MAAATALAALLALPAAPAAAGPAGPGAAAGAAGTPSATGAGTPADGTATASGTASGSAAPQSGWIPDGTPVRGTPRAAGAPLLDAGHDYRDTIATGQVLHYAVRLAATGDAAAPATDYLSAFAVPAPGSHVGPFDGLTLHLVASDGTLCDYTTARFPGVDAAVPVGGAVRRPGSAGSVCRAAGTYVLEVQRDSAPGSDQDDWRLDLRHTAEPAAAAPAAAGPVPGYSAASAAPPTGRGSAVTGASSMDGTGTVLPGPGVYRDTLVPGATRYYRVPVGWGQRLLATASFGAAPGAAPGAFVAGGLGLALYSPVRGQVDSSTLSWTGHAADLDVQTPVVLYANRRSGDVRVNSAAVAGDYYLAVTLHPQLADRGAAEVPVTLRLRVAGTAQAGPGWAGAPGPTGPAPAANGTASATPGTARTASPVRRPLAWGSFTMAGVLTVWSTALLRLRRRRRPVSR